jgi:signal peptidase II
VLNLTHRRLWLPVLLALVIITLDQLTKAWIVATLGPLTLTKFIPLIGDWARLAYSHNTGVAFSLFSGQSNVLTLLALGILGGAIYFYWTQLPNTRLPVQVAMGLIAGGALGNLIDRIRLGYVVDFIQIGWWPIFNVADSAICIGAALLFIQFWHESAFRAEGEQVSAPQQ